MAAQEPADQLIRVIERAQGFDAQQDEVERRLGAGHRAFGVVLALLPQLRLALQELFAIEVGNDVGGGAGTGGVLSDVWQLRMRLLRRGKSKAQLQSSSVTHVCQRTCRAAR